MSDNKLKKCILCRKQIHTKCRQSYVIKDTENIKRWNNQSINSLCDVLFKSQTTAETENLKTLLLNGTFCTDCRESIWDIDFTFRMIQRLESKLKKLTNKIISDLSENHQKLKTHIQKELSYAETVDVLFNGLRGRRPPQNQAVGKDKKDDPTVTVPLKPFADGEGFFIIKDEDDDDFNLDPDETHTLEEVEDDNTTVEKEKSSESEKKYPKWNKWTVKCSETDCHQLFKDKLCMEAHVRKKHLGLKRHPCNQCNKDFNSLYHLRSHLMRHEGKSRFKCSHSNCTKTFTSGFRMKIHIQNHHSSKVHSQKCSICSKGFDTSKDLEAHSVIHKGKNPFKCEDCSKVFSNSATLSYHVKVSHQNPHKYFCSICTNSFSTLVYLQAHKRLMHPGKNKSFKCPLCEEKFLKMSAVRKHRKIHLPKKVFHCYFCGKPFNNEDVLKSHVLSHLDEKHYKCQLCHQEFIQSSTLRYHEKRHHSGVKTGICSICGKTFTNRPSLIKHEKRHKELENIVHNLN